MIIIGRIDKAFKTADEDEKQWYNWSIMILKMNIYKYILVEGLK